MSSSDDGPFPFSDLSLSRRLERAEGHGCVEYAEARARLSPDSGAAWIEAAGAYAVFDGVTSPVTQTFGLGLFEKPTRADMEVIEAFFRTRGAPVYHEVSPLADLSLLPLLNERGYQPFELTSVLFRTIAPGLRLTAPRNERIQVRQVQVEDWELWAQTAVRGWAEFGDPDQLRELTRISAAKPNLLAFLAELDGQAIASGALAIWQGVALLAGASTIPEARNQGAQLALLESRLRAGAEAGCDIAMMGALPGSTSQRNAERNGFRIAYTRIKWRLPQGSAQP
jgi:hypothetical protein